MHETDAAVSEVAECRIAARRRLDEAVAMAVEFMRLHKDFMPQWEGTCEVREFASPPQ